MPEKQLPHLTHESLDRIEKLAEWRGRVSGALDTISKALTDLDLHQTEIEKENRKEIQNLRDCFQSKLSEVDKELKTSIQEVGKAVKEVDKRVTGLYVKVAGIGASVSVLMWILLNIVLKAIFS